MLPIIQLPITMKIPATPLLALSGILLAGGFSSCTNHQTPASVNTGNATTSTTVEKDVSYSGSDTIRRQTSVASAAQD